MTGKLSLRFNAKLSKKDNRAFLRLVNPLTRPAHISPKKKVSWRLVKKWFNRYEKSEWLKRTLIANSKDGKSQVHIRVTDVQIHKAGGHKVSYTFNGKGI